jgi:hypothetical protein
MADFSASMDLVVSPLPDLQERFDLHGVTFPNSFRIFRDLLPPFMQCGDMLLPTEDGYFADISLALPKLPIPLSVVAIAPQFMQRAGSGVFQVAFPFAQIGQRTDQEGQDQYGMIRFDAGAVQTLGRYPADELTGYLGKFSVTMCAFYKPASLLIKREVPDSFRAYMAMLFGGMMAN